MKFRSFVYSLLVYFNVIAFAHSKSQPICLTGGRAKKFTDRMVEKHNEYRRLHERDVPLLVADDALTKGSIDWSEELALENKLEHSPNPQYEYGENLYMQYYSGGAIDDSSLNPVKPWYDEIKYYQGGFSLKTGHYTQVVWKSTLRVGCGVCAISPYLYVTCRYGPPGNYNGEFEENVLPLRSTRDNPSGTMNKNKIPSSKTPITDNTDITPNPNVALEYLMTLLFAILTLFSLGLIVVIILSVIIYYYVMNYHKPCIVPM